MGLGNTDNIGDDELPSSIGAIDLGSRIVQVATGNFHTCALLDTQEVKCWGGNNFGQLGYGNTNAIGDDESLAGLPAVNIGANVTSIATGNFTTCAHMADNSLKCWGSGSLGKLGLGHEDTIGDDEVPADIDPILIGSDISQVTAGINHTCVLGLDNGQVKCFGQGLFGQLGNGDIDNIGDDEVPNALDFLSLL